VPSHSSPDFQPTSDAENYIAISSRGIEPVTANELRRLGATQTKEFVGAVHFTATPETFYRACLQVRTVSRIVKPLKEFAAANPEMLYSQVRRIPWEIYLNAKRTLAVYATIEGSGGRSRNVNDNSRQTSPTRGGKAPPKPGPGGKAQGINHSQYAALKIKDAIVDRLRQELGARPNVDTINPDVRIHAFFAGGRCTLSLDATGASLHERGYRVQNTSAPLKETLASAIVDLTGYNGKVPLYDPMCGSGTLVIEAARKALKIAPGLNRDRYACQRWPDHDNLIWQQALSSVKGERLETLDAPIFASDCDPAALRAAKANAEAAGVAHVIQFEQRRIEDSVPPCAGPGIVVVNPPYGERLGKDDALSELYQQIGKVWTERFKGWTAFFFAGNLGLTRDLGLEATARYKLYNGPIDCRLLKFPL
jgi:putative N6-adenine-specific DNA methylase